MVSLVAVLAVIVFIRCHEVKQQMSKFQILI